MNEFCIEECRLWTIFSYPLVLGCFFVIWAIVLARQNSGWLSMMIAIPRVATWPDPSFREEWIPICCAAFNCCARFCNAILWWNGLRWHQKVIIISTNGLCCAQICNVILWYKCTCLKDSVYKTVGELRQLFYKLSWRLAKQLWNMLLASICYSFLECY